MKLSIITATAAIALAMAAPASAFTLGGGDRNTNTNSNLNANANSNRNNNLNANSNRNTNVMGQGQAQGQLQGQAQGQSQSSTSRSSASADNTNTVSNTVSNSTSNNVSNSTANNVNINDRLQAPSMGGMGMSSGHPCAYGGNSFVLSIVGGGASYGGNANRIDDACMLGQMGYGQAAMLMVAGRSPEAARALQAAGYIAPAPTAAPVTSSRSTPVAHYSECKKRADGALLVKVARNKDKATAVAQCKAAMNF